LLSDVECFLIGAVDTSNSDIGGVADACGTWLFQIEQVRWSQSGVAQKSCPVISLGSCAYDLHMFFTRNKAGIGKCNEVVVLEP
jgi:hypothetical protein